MSDIGEENFIKPKYVCPNCDGLQIHFAEDGIGEEIIAFGIDLQSTEDGAKFYEPWLN